MLLFGHLGITLGTVLFFNHLIRSRIKKPLPDNNSNRQIKESNSYQSSKRNMLGWSEFLACIVGSILPDLIDKPIGHYLFSETFGNNGRIFSHTLIFAFIILFLAIYLFAYRRTTWGLFLSFGVFMHLILDFMWETPQTLFWPFQGFSFPMTIEYNWLWSILHGLVSNPFEYISEIVGLLSIVLLTIVLIRTKYINLPIHKKRIMRT